MGREDESELNLELSIGGRYGETTNSKGQIWKSAEGNAEGGTPNCGDVRRRKEVQALRRQEARRKREEKIRKARGQNGVFAEDRLFWEAQKLQARAVERESRERDCTSEERGGKSCSNRGGGDDLSLSLSTENRGHGLYNKVQQWWGRNVGDGNLSVESEYSNGRKTTSLEQCSSTVSDYQSMSHRGGCSSDTGSHSSLQPYHPPTIKNESDHLESHTSSSPDDAEQVSTGPKRPPHSPDSFPDTNNASSTSENLSGEERSGHNAAAASIPRMPCVSATGSGPNAKTVIGFLYKYTKTEVSIVCVCHGNSFSPAAFVEHAGGVDVTQPLRHITIVPMALR